MKRLIVSEILAISEVRNGAMDVFGHMYGERLQALSVGSWRTS